MTKTPYLTVLLLVALTIIGNACGVSAGTQPARTGHYFADTFLTSINVECGSLVSYIECLDFMQRFQWPLSVPVPFLTNLTHNVSRSLCLFFDRFSRWRERSPT